MEGQQSTINDFIEVKTDGRRQFLRKTEILRLEETADGKALIHTDSWSEDPLKTEDTYAQVKGAIISYIKQY